MKIGKFEEFNNADFYDLKVPTGTENMSTLEAALSWAKNGFYVLPLQNGSKHPGSVVGSGWPEKSSRDEAQIKAWFNSSDYGLAIHVGKSGAICFDVDTPERLPKILKDRLSLQEVPYQSTREGDSLRGHYLFATEIGRQYSNSNGRLGKEWGEVRGENGIIVVSPSLHAKSSEGGRYLWQRCGLLPLLPRVIEERLNQSSTTYTKKATHDEVTTFLEEHSTGNFLEVLQQRIDEAFDEARVGSRHDTTRDLLLKCLKEARAGLYPAEKVISEVGNLFNAIKPEQERNEFIGLVEWVVGQVLDTPQEEIDAIRYQVEVMNSEGFRQLIKGYQELHPELSNPIQELDTKPQPEVASDISSYDQTPTFEERLESNPALRKEFERLVLQHEAKEALNAILKAKESSHTADLQLASMKEEEFREKIGQVDWLQLWADKSIERWYVPGLICDSRAHGIYAASGLGKSLLVLDIAAALATGRSALGFPVQEPIKVLYIDNENTPLGDIRPRLQQMGYEASDLSNLTYLSFPEIAPLNTAEGGRSLMTILDKFQPQLVVLDTFSRFVDGDENLSTTTLEFYNWVGRVLKKRKIAYIRIDHVGKKSERGARGSSAKIDDLDLIWSLEKGNAASEFVLENKKSRAVITKRKLLIERQEAPLRHVIRDMGALDWKALIEKAELFKVATGLIGELHKVNPDHTLAESKTWTDLKARCKGAGISRRLLFDALAHYKNPDNEIDNFEEWEEM